MAWTSEAYRHGVSLGTGDGHGRQDLAWTENHQRNACRLFDETCRCRNDAKCDGLIGNEIPVRREQGNPESVILSDDRDDFCAETWKLVINGSGNANSGGYSCGTGSILHDELMDIWSEVNLSFNDTWRRAGQRQCMNRIRESFENSDATVQFMFLCNSNFPCSSEFHCGWEQSALPEISIRMRISNVARVSNNVRESVCTLL